MATKNKRQDQEKKTEEPATNNDPKQPREVSGNWFLIPLGLMLLLVVAVIFLHKGC
jgi:hypothetical protein